MSTPSQIPLLSVTYNPYNQDRINGVGRNEASPDRTCLSSNDGTISQMVLNYYESQLIVPELEEHATTEATPSSIANLMKGASRGYIQKHIHWEPHMVIDEQFTELRKEPLSQHSAHLSDQFSTYVHLAENIGPQPLPPLYYHSAVTTDENIYLIGGSTCLYQNHNPQELPSLSKIRNLNEIQFPTPVNSKLLNNPCIVPNRKFYVLSSQTRVLREFLPRGDIPPPLMCMTGSTISDRYILYHGGFELVRKVTKNVKDGCLELTDDLVMNEYVYILDVKTLTFEKFDLKFTDSNETAPRFGHSSTAVTSFKVHSMPSNLSRSNLHLDQSDTQGNDLKLSTIYVMGGYVLKPKPNGSKEFQPVADMWKIQFDVEYYGKHDFLRFSKDMKMVAVPTSCHCAPPVRAFHVSQIFDPESVITVREKQSKTQGLKLIIHGGTNGTEILGDVWSFDILSGQWEQITTYYPAFDADTFQFNKDGEKFQCVIRKCGHKSFVFDKFLVLIMGSVPSNFPTVSKSPKEDSGSDDDVHDISELFIDFVDHSKLTQGSDNEGGKELQYHRIFILDLTTQTWFLHKVFHSYSRHVGSQSQLSYTGLVGSSANIANGRVYCIGGEFMINLESAESNPDFIKREMLGNVVQVLDFPFSGFNYQERLRQFNLQTAQSRVRTGHRHIIKQKAMKA
ncbi:hypothetical protein WICPIJ_006212 [Wickerhamomyces pijperi]|uniref:Uncharacterized protein n=1 Tax=Wickerhamomyces pijperi TaxID=599730 RepID=A0A9P8TL69_WICPI|nr:hypothetical protein WICPIJ_006212 [Wickerhamomyces pijperi]